MFWIFKKYSLEELNTIRMNYNKFSKEQKDKHRKSVYKKFTRPKSSLPQYLINFELQLKEEIDNESGAK